MGGDVRTIMNQEAVGNSGWSWGRPSFRLPRREKYSTSRKTTQPCCTHARMSYPLQDKVNKLHALHAWSYDLSHSRDAECGGTSSEFRHVGWRFSLG